MEITKYNLAFLVTLLIGIKEINSTKPVDTNKDLGHSKLATDEINPLSSLILNQKENDKNPTSTRGPSKDVLSRVKRQYGYPYGRYYPVPVPIFLGGFGGFGFGGRGFGGRGFGGRGFGGRGFGGRGFGGRGIGGGFGGRGGFGGGIGGGHGGGRG